MRFMFGVAVLLVWMIFELKDFFNNGGFHNVIAFNLLKIVIIGIMLALILIMSLFIELLPQVFQEVVIHKFKDLPKAPFKPIRIPKFEKKPLAEEANAFSRKNSF